MRILFVDSGAKGFHSRYAFDIFFTLKKLRHKVRQISPPQLSPKLIQKFQPDVLLVVHGTRTPLYHVRYARSLGVKTVLWIVEDPYEIDLHRGEMVEAYDLVYTNERQAVKHYKPVKVSYLPWCCNPEVHRRMEVGEEYQSDLCFVGMGFPNRLRIINAIAPLLKKLNVKLIGRWERWGELHPDLHKFVLPVENDFYEVQKYFNGAKINLNIHRDPVNPPSGNSRKVGATSPNDRTFALAGCGAFQLVDATRPDLLDCFVENKEIVLFTSPRDLARKIEYYLANPKLRQKIGKAAQKRAYREHTFERRLKQIFTDLGTIPKKNRLAALSQPTVYNLRNEYVSNEEIWRFRG
ncbi:MAG: glycosyltransferase [Firmicutes bacterium]|nr:glycosyltransferase [Bacillota bacterium]